MAYTRNVSVLIVLLSAVPFLRQCQADLEHTHYNISKYSQTKPSSKFTNRMRSDDAVRIRHKDDVITEDKNYPIRDEKVTVDDSTASFHPQGEIGRPDNIESKIDTSNNQQKFQNILNINFGKNTDFDTKRSSFGPIDTNRQQNQCKSICRWTCARCYGHDISTLNRMCRHQCVHPKSGRKVFQYCLNELKQIDPPKWQKFRKLLPCNTMNTKESIVLWTEHLDQSQSNTGYSSAASREITLNLSKREMTRNISEGEATHQPVKRNMCRSVCTLCERMGSAGISTSCQRNCVNSPMGSQAFGYCLNLWLQNRT